MRYVQKFIRRCVRHAALHAGAIVAAVYHGVLPPQISHAEEQLVQLDSATAWQFFVRAVTGRLEERG